jgi:hypothetical protein
MCRADVHASAGQALAGILAEIRDALAREQGTDPAQIRIGPVDLGWGDEQPGQAQAQGPAGRAQHR